MAQHHGLPTLLLDWSLDPFVALYFAVYRQPNQIGRVWLMTLQPKPDRKEMMIYLEDEVTDPKVLLQPSKTTLVVVPCVFTRRIEAQEGRFTYSGEADGEHEFSLINPKEQKPWEKIECFSISAKSKKHIIGQLTQCRVHEGRIFPDLDGYARYLSESGL